MGDMTATDNYRVLLSGGEGEIVEKKSRFISTIRKCETEEEAVAFIEEMKKKYWDARHNCSAFIIGSRGELTRCSDDGEPSGTAGRPMLEVLTGSGQYFQHRTPRRSGGFPVIAAPGQFASASYYKCRTVVSGIPVFFLHFFYKSHCFFLGFTLADRRDKAGLFLHDFAFPAGQKDSIVICCCHVTHVWPHLFLNSYFLLLSFSV